MSEGLFCPGDESGIDRTVVSANLHELYKSISVIHSLCTAVRSPHSSYQVSGLTRCGKSISVMLSFHTPPPSQVYPDRTRQKLISGKSQKIPPLILPSTPHSPPPAPSSVW
ncbi:hypothetical protein DPEC_G00322490 [Dallia pectoralis]|uniref:Uncharacterized protein n=1 Tax=Dallia pectoralis TaxID=75939 RepID=A0ACC2FAF7_DALPE|nr:hypothetical protein DPEC_G00322490 [Dallia pectoralis]